MAFAPTPDDVDGFPTEARWAYERLLSLDLQPRASLADQVDRHLVDLEEARDEVLDLEFAGLEAARPTPEVLEALEGADLVVLGPSNPFVSLGPILAVPGLREALRRSRARKVAVSPIVGGQALKGPAAAMLGSLGHEVSALGVARLLADEVDEFVLDEADAALAPAVEALGLVPRVLPTVMVGPEGRLALGQRLLER